MLLKTVYHVSFAAASRLHQQPRDESIGFAAIIPRFPAPRLCRARKSPTHKTLQAFAVFRFSKLRCSFCQAEIDLPA